MKYIRSDVPTSVTEKERLWLLENGVRAVLDLRTEEERKTKPCPLSADLRFAYRTLAIRGGSEIPKNVDAVSESYISMVDSRLEAAVTDMLTADSGFIYFCNVGKDRTGVLSAMLLTRLGKDREYIVKDYMLSDDNLRDMLESFSLSHPEIDAEIITPHREYIERFLDWYTKHNR